MMDARVLIPAEFALIHGPLAQESAGSRRLGLALCAQRRVEAGARFWPEQGAVRLGRLPEHSASHAYPQQLLRQFGCYDEVTHNPGERPTRRCNWVRFLPTARAGENSANLRAALRPDGRPEFEALRPIAPSSPLVAVFSTHLDDTVPTGCIATVAKILQEGPLDLSQDLLPPSTLESPISPQPAAIKVTTSGSLRLRGQQRTLLPCEVCGKAFDRPSLLKRHMRTHTGERPHACDVCEKRFSTSSSLNTHRRIHSGEKPHACGVCGKRFTASSNLYYHRMTHTKEKPHKCALCLKSFPTPGDLRSHQYVHSGAWPFRCNACGRGFSKQTNLRNHLFLHTGDKPHVCTLCGKKFALACNLRAHAKTHEEEGLEEVIDVTAPSSVSSDSPPPARSADYPISSSDDHEKASTQLKNWDIYANHASQQISVDMAKVAALWSAGCSPVFPFSPDDLQQGLMFEAQMLLNALQQQKQLQPASI